MGNAGLQAWHIRLEFESAEPSRTVQIDRLARS